LIVLDASAAVDWLLATPAGQLIEKRIYTSHESLYAPHIFDLEVVQVFRRLAQQGIVSSLRASEGIQDLLALRVVRYPHLIFVPRIWQLRNNLSAYDAAYIALAENLAAPLITRDARLAGVPGHSALVEVF